MLNVQWFEDDGDALRKWDRDYQVAYSRWKNSDAVVLAHHSRMMLTTFESPPRPPGIKRTGRLLNTAKSGGDWHALVVRDDDGRIVELDPLKLSQSPA